MKATLEFNLPEDSEQFAVASNATSFYFALYDLDQKLRSWIKYDHDFEDVETALDEIRETLWNSMSEHNVNFDMLS